MFTNSKHPSYINRPGPEALCGVRLLWKPGIQSSASPDASGRGMGRQKRCVRKRRRGKCAGVCAWLRANPSWLALPSILLSNARSLDKINWTTSNSSRLHSGNLGTAAFLFSQKHGSVPDTTIQLHRLTSFRANRNVALCGKTRGGGLCIYMNMEWLWTIRPLVCCANSGTQTAHQMLQTGSETAETLACRSSLRASGLLCSGRLQQTNHTILEVYTSSVTSHINKGIDDVTVFQAITIHSNQKLWMAAEVGELLKTRDHAYRAVDKAAL